MLGRCFDRHILDMIELGIDRFVSMKEIKVSKFTQCFILRKRVKFIINNTTTVCLTLCLHLRLTKVSIYFGQFN